MALRVLFEAEGGHAHGWQCLQGRGIRGLQCCRLYRIHSCAVGCGGGGRGTDAGIEELHIARHEARCNSLHLRVDSDEWVRGTVGRPCRPTVVVIQSLNVELANRSMQY